MNCNDDIHTITIVHYTVMQYCFAIMAFLKYIMYILLAYRI